MGPWRHSEAAKAAAAAVGDDHAVVAYATEGIDSDAKSCVDFAGSDEIGIGAVANAVAAAEGCDAGCAGNADLSCWTYVWAL